MVWQTLGASFAVKASLVSLKAIAKTMRYQYYGNYVGNLILDFGGCLSQDKLVSAV
jgi:hypothetical protein